MPEPATPPALSAPAPSHAELFFAFFRITLSGFGGTLPWTRRMFVEEKRWMTDEEFNHLYALCQFLPGPNIVNLASVFGSRMRGPTGAIAAWFGFMVLPFCMMIAVGLLYEPTATSRRRAACCRARARRRRADRRDGGEDGRAVVPRLRTCAVRRRRHGRGDRRDALAAAAGACWCWRRSASALAWWSRR
jgi:hypothetical protein